MQLFLGLTFSDYYLQYKKIDIYRRRFDSKYTKSNILQMTILPPFEISECTEDFIEAIEDELEGHLVGHEVIQDVQFSGVDFNSEKKGSIFLRPELSLELQYCQQSLWEVIQDFGGSFKKRRPIISNNEIVQRAYLPIGRTKGIDQFDHAIQVAKEQFEEPFQLRSNGIALFESVPGQWLLKKHLFHFDFTDNHFTEMDGVQAQIQALYV